MMTEGSSAPTVEIEELLGRLEDARSSLTAVVKDAESNQFAP